MGGRAAEYADVMQSTANRARNQPARCSFPRHPEAGFIGTASGRPGSVLSVNVIHGFSRTSIPGDVHRRHLPLDRGPDGGRAPRSRIRSIGIHRRAYVARLRQSRDPHSRGSDPSLPCVRPEWPAGLHAPFDRPADGQLPGSSSGGRASIGPRLFILVPLLGKTRSPLLLTVIHLCT